MPNYYSSAALCVDETIAKVGKDIVLGLPLGLGKANHAANAFYRRAKKDSGLKLKIITALSLEIPKTADPMLQRFLDPILARMYAGYPELEYVSDRSRNKLPKNVEIAEFFFQPGALLKDARAQQNYLSSNYTHVARDLMANGVNVIAQMTSKTTIDGHTYYSLSCNPDITLDLVPRLRALDEKPLVVIAEVNLELPFMHRDAMVGEDFFDAVIESEEPRYTLFSVPKEPISLAEHLIGLHASALIKDGGTLQIGIGGLGDALVHSLLLRHQQNATYNQLLQTAGILERSKDIVERLGGTGLFEQGLYGATEMLVDGLIPLLRNGVLKRSVYPHKIVQKLLNDKKLEFELPSELLELLLNEGLSPQLEENDFLTLQSMGIFAQDLAYEDGALIDANGDRVPANLKDPATRSFLQRHGIGRSLTNGVVVHAAFYLGSSDLYGALRDMSLEDNQQICMTRVSFTNELYGKDFALKALQRQLGRFYNNAMMVTLTGAVISDALDDTRVVSGVGGQYNFVAMAHALPEARSIILLPSTRTKNGQTRSNIVWDYAQCTVPRHLRDIVITEYGIADLRSRTDAEVIASLLNIADSRFQRPLLRQAKEAGKLGKHYKIPRIHRRNTPKHLENRFRKVRDAFPYFPLGSELDETERMLAVALDQLKTEVGNQKFPLRQLLKTWRMKSVPNRYQEHISRIGLQTPQTLREKMVRRLLLFALHDLNRD